MVPDAGTILYQSDALRPPHTFTLRTLASDAGAVACVEA